MTSYKVAGRGAPPAPHTSSDAVRERALPCMLSSFSSSSSSSSSSSAAATATQGLASPFEAGSRGGGGSNGIGDAAISGLDQDLFGFDSFFGTLMKSEQVTRSSYATLSGVGGGHHGHQEEESSISAFGGQLVSIGIPVDGDSGGGAAPFSFGGVFGVGDPMQISTGRMAGRAALHWVFGQPGETLNFDFPPVAPLQHGSFEERPE